jgi:DNA-binding LacI/PurR family transcriptional regulator
VEGRGRVDRPRLKDVARAAGVSVATVSLVLNDRHEGVRIPAETRRRVRQAAEDLGYAPNALARSLRVQRSQTIGLISDELVTTPFAVPIVQAAQEAAWRRGYLLFLLDTGGDPQNERAAIASLRQQQVAAMIYATMYHRVVPVPPGLPERTVFVNCRPRDDDHPAAVPDERAGARSAVSELLDHGHRRIAFLDDELAPEASGLRLLGLRDALAEGGASFDPGLHLKAPAVAAGGLAVGALLDLPRERRPTGVFCFSDRMAMGAYRAARQRGLRVPQDLSVVGFDDQEFIASELDPPLTTVALPHREMGRWAVETLLGGLDESAGLRSAHATSAVLVPCPLVRRQSVAPPAV